MRRRWRELRFIGLLAFAGLSIGASIWQGLGVEAPARAAGFRRIDPRLLESKLQDGTLSRHEAEYWRPEGEPARVP